MLTHLSITVSLDRRFATYEGGEKQTSLISNNAGRAQKWRYVAAEMQTNE